MDGFGRQGLMRVRLANALRAVSSDEVGVYPRWKLSTLCFARWEVTHRSKHFAGEVPGGERVQDLAHASQRGASRQLNRAKSRMPHGERMGHQELLLRFAFCSPA